MPVWRLHEFFESALRRRYLVQRLPVRWSLLLGEAVFAKLPDLVQTSFRETPRLDNVSLPAPGFFPWLSSKAALEEQAKFRATAGLAVVGQDYDNESKAFKGEVRSRRGTLDQPWDAVFWFGAMYDVLSDFGRSMTRPFHAWLVSIAAFTAAYLADAGKLGGTPSAAPGRTPMPCPNG